MSLSPPPYRDKDLTSQSWQKWFASIPDALKSMTTSAANAVTTWASINKAGSRLTDIETRNHDDLQNLNTNTHVHLTHTQYTGLTGGGETALHRHSETGKSGGEFFMLDIPDVSDGIDGIPGKDGKDGKDGINGFNGQDGEDGEVIFIPVSSTIAGYTVATLPVGTIGMRAYVTDATAPTWLGALIGGGAVNCPVFHNGTAWVAG